MTRITRGHPLRMLAAPAAIIAACLIAFAAFPPEGTGAYWTSAAAGSSSAAGTAQWCSAPDPAASGSRFIRLSTITTSVGTNEQMAIIPVANNAAWGGGTGTKSLGVRLWGCQTAPVGSLRVTAWSNPSTAVADNWLTGSTVAPASRLNPASGLGAQLSSLALGASTSGIYLVGGSTGDVRRYSWLIANGRTSASPATDPAQCVYLLTAVSACTPSLINSSGTDNTFAQLFNVTPFASTTLAPTSFTAHTWATQSAAGWGATNSWLNVTCNVLGLLVCGTNVTTTTLTGTAASDATLLASTNGNLMQWVVVQWTGTTPPPSDLVLEVFVE